MQSAFAGNLLADGRKVLTTDGQVDKQDIFLNASGDAVLDTAGHVSADYAKEFAETEFEKYRVIQDRLFQSDFDRLMDGDDLPELPKAEQ